MLVKIPAAPNQVPFIGTISISNVAYPLYDPLTNPVVYQFSPGETKIYDSKTPPNAEPAAIPACMDSKTATFSFVLSTEGLLLLANAALITPPYTLTCNSMTGDFFTFKTPVLDLTKGLQNLSMVAPAVGGKPKPLPWALSGPLTWMIKGSKPDQLTYTCTTDLELYAFPPNVHASFQDSGFPLPLLRDARYLPKWMTLPAVDDVEPGMQWAAFATNALFNDERLRYTPWDGICRYTNWNPTTDPRDYAAFNSKLDCRFDSWISDLERAERDKTQIPIHSIDLAAVCQMVVSMGVDLTANEIRLNYMKPFGFMKPTKIIGRFPAVIDPADKNAGMCNNPLYGCPGVDSRMLCPEKSSSRSKWDSHAFLSIASTKGKFVLDPCVGPQLGTTTFADYPSTVIDTSPNLYVTHNRHGEFADIIDGNGVTTVSHLSCLTRATDGPPPASPPKTGPSNAGPSTTGLATAGTAALGTLLDDIGKSQPSRVPHPQVFFPFDNTKAVFSWTFVPPYYPKDLVTATIFRYPDYTRTISAYTGLLENENMAKWVQSDALSGYTDALPGSIRVVCDGNRYYVLTVESMSEKAQSIKDLTDRISGLMHKYTRSHDLPSPVQYIDSFTMLPATQPEVGKTFKLMITLSDLGNQFWRGFNVVPSTNVMLTESKVGATNKTVEFTFLAKSEGFASIVIAVYGSSLEVDSARVNVWVTKPAPVAAIS